MLHHTNPQPIVFEDDFIHLPDPDFFNLESELWEDEYEDDESEEYEEEYE